MINFLNFARNLLRWIAKLLSLIVATFVLLSIIPSPFPGGPEALTYGESLMEALEMLVFSAGFFFVAILGNRINQSTLLRFIAGIFLAISIVAASGSILNFLHKYDGANHLFFPVGILLISLAMFFAFIWPISLKHRS
jgi:hypothetical protein